MSNHIFRAILHFKHLYPILSQSPCLVRIGNYGEHSIVKWRLCQQLDYIPTYYLHNYWPLIVGRM